MVGVPSLGTRADGAGIPKQQTRPRGWNARFYDNRGDYNEKGEFVRLPHNPPFDKMDDPNTYPTVNGQYCTCKECEGEHFSTTYTLGEFMLALFDDICFHGTPASRDERMENLIRVRDEVLSGKMETVSLDLDAALEQGCKKTSS